MSCWLTKGVHEPRPIHPDLCHALGWLFPCGPVVGIVSMSHNPFANWTQEMVDLHNARVTRHAPKMDKELEQKQIEAYQKQAKQMPAPKKRIRQNPKPLMNKLELEAMTWLGGQYPIEELHCQAIRFRLGNGVHFTPDIVCLTHGTPLAWEVKGPWATDDAIVKLKMAATVWPHIHWFLIWKESGQWQQQLILSDNFHA